MRILDFSGILVAAHNLVVAHVSPHHLLRSERRLAPTHVGGYKVMGREAEGRSIRDKSAWDLAARRLEEPGWQIELPGI